MPKLGSKSKIALGLVICFTLIVVSGLLFPVPQPVVHLSPNYGGSAPEPFYRLGPIYITNTLIASWLGILVLIGLFYFATRKMKLVPKGLQNFAEAIIEILLNFVESVAGKKNGRKFFPIIATIFLYVLMNAWIALLPFFNVIGRAHYGTSDTLFYKLTGYGQYSGPIIDVTVFRAANTDINLTLMLALIAFVCVEYWGITSLGLRHYMSKFIRLGGVVQGLGQFIRGRIKEALGAILFGLINMFIGALELLSEFVRIISFTFRLFGNMTAGEILLLMMAFLIPWIIPAIFYGLEAFIGIIQAFIFAGLTLVFATMAVRAHESEHK